MTTLKGSVRPDINICISICYLLTSLVLKCHLISTVWSTSVECQYGNQTKELVDLMWFDHTKIHSSWSRFIYQQLNNTGLHSEMRKPSYCTRKTIIYLVVEDELSLIAWGEKLLCSLVDTSVLLGRQQQRKGWSWGGSRLRCSLCCRALLSWTVYKPWTFVMFRVRILFYCSSVKVNKNLPSWEI